MHRTITTLFRTTAALTIAVSALQAQERMVTVTVTNLARPNGIAFAAAHFGFHRGAFDSFNIGNPAGPGIVSVAEAGTGVQWQADFAAADPTATRGMIAGGALRPGQSRSQSFIVNAGLNRFFSFASMVVPSNDFFIGNDNPQQYRMFDAAGNLLINSITQTASQIWDAGSESFSIGGAAFLVNGVGAVRTPQNGVVSFNFSELMNFDGQMTTAGYVFNSGLAANDAIYRFDFTATEVVPEPATYVLFGSGLMMLGVIARRKRSKA